jgi:hypothetical protein
MTTTLNASTAGAGGFIATSDNSGSLALQTAGTTAVTIDTSQKVGIGTTSPSVKLEINPPALSGTIQEVFKITDSANSTLAIRQTTTVNDIYANNVLSLSTNGAERMRIDSSGNLLMGRTSTVTNPASSGAIVYASSGYSSTDGTTTANYTKDRIYFNASNYYVLNGSSTGVVLPSGNTSWSSQSDERTKDIIEPIQNATQKLSDLRCVIGKYKTDDLNKRRVFLIAQDVQKVLPEAVTELGDENKTLALSYSDIIPLLTAAIQELSAKNDALTARIVALETA